MSMRDDLPGVLARLWRAHHNATIDLVEALQTAERWLGDGLNNAILGSGKVAPIASNLANAADPSLRSGDAWFRIFVPLLDQYVLCSPGRRRFSVVAKRGRLMESVGR